MPIVNQASTGGLAVVPTFLNRQFLGDITTTGETSIIQVDQLPNLFFYAIQTAGASPLVITPQAAVRQNANNEPDFFPLVGPTALPGLNLPLILNFEFPATFIRIQFTHTPAVTHSVRLIWGAYGP